jgi:hypothetical protein
MTPMTYDEKDKTGTAVNKSKKIIFSSMCKSVKLGVGLGSGSGSASKRKVKSASTNLYQVHLFL